jgi:hypothetical protein
MNYQAQGGKNFSIFVSDIGEMYSVGYAADGQLGIAFELVGVCLCVYVLFIYKYINIQIYMYNIYVCMYVCIYIYIYVCVCIHMVRRGWATWNSV